MGQGKLGPFNAGFNEYCLWHMEDVYGPKGSRYRNPKVVQNGKLLGILEGKYGPDVFCDYIIDFIERNKSKPFLVYYPMALTHAPFQPTPDSPEWGRNVQDRKFFKDMVEYMDKTIGRIVKKLYALGLRENTLILFTADNGTPRGIATEMKDGRIIKGGKGQTTDAGTIGLVPETFLDHKGTEFILAFLPTKPRDPLDPLDLDPELSLIITSDLPADVDVTVEYPVNSPTFTRTVTISRDQPQEVVFDSASPATAWQPLEVFNNAVRISATGEVSVVMVNKKLQNFGTIPNPFIDSAIRDKALALPTEALGNDYIVMSKTPAQSQGSEYVIVASQDNTLVITNPILGTPFSIPLNRGEGILIESDDDLTGSIVTSDKPVAVINGNKCANMPTGVNYCEHLFEMAVPVSRWGTDFLARNLPRAIDGDGARRTFYRILGSQDGTQVFLDGAIIGTVGAGGFLEVERDASQLVNHFSATSPIFVVQYMNSTCDEFPNAASCLDVTAPVQESEFGDPSMANLVPVGQFPHIYTFTCPGGRGRSWVTVIARTADVQSGRVLLDGRAMESLSFSEFPTMPKFSHASVPVDSGLHTSRSANGHVITAVWLGWHTAITNPLGVQFED